MVKSFKTILLNLKTYLYTIFFENYSFRRDGMSGKTRRRKRNKIKNRVHIFHIKSEILKVVYKTRISVHKITQIYKF